MNFQNGLQWTWVHHTRSRNYYHEDELSSDFQRFHEILDYKKLELHGIELNMFLLWLKDACKIQLLIFVTKDTLTSLKFRFLTIPSITRELDNLKSIPLSPVEGKLLIVQGLTRSMCGGCVGEFYIGMSVGVRKSTCLHFQTKCLDQRMTLQLSVLLCSASNVGRPWRYHAGTTEALIVHRIKKYSYL